MNFDADPAVFTTGNVPFVYEMSRLVLPQAPSPITTSLRRIPDPEGDVRLVKDRGLEAPSYRLLGTVSVDLGSGIAGKTNVCS